MSTKVSMLYPISSGLDNEFKNAESSNPGIRAAEPGKNMSACAKMIGITPAAFTLSGRYCLTPPVCLLPTIRLAYWTGILRVACTSAITARITTTQMTNSTMSSIT